MRDSESGHLVNGKKINVVHKKINKIFTVGISASRFSRDLPDVSSRIVSISSTCSDDDTSGHISPIIWESPIAKPVLHSHCLWELASLF